MEEAIDIAQSLLSQGECQKAIDLLEDVGRDLKNPIYLQVLASGYACRAGFDEITFFSQDIPVLDITAAGFLNSLTQFSTSAETEADSETYKDLRIAINILLEIKEGEAPSQADRNTTFGKRRAGDMGSQYLFLALAQLGKFLHFYGNVNAAGNKGLGAAGVDEQGATASTCFVDYEAATDAAAYVDLGTSPGGICDDTTVDIGHPDLSFAVASIDTSKRRMCEGLMLFTNIVDVLKNIDLSSNTSLGNITQLMTLLDTFESSVTTVDPGLQTLYDMTSQADCESYVSNQANFERLQLMYAVLFETGL